MRRGRVWRLTVLLGLATVSGDSVTTNEDFSNLQSQLGKVTPSATQMSAYSATNSPAACPSEDGSTWAANSTVLPPPPNQQLCSCMYNSLSCVVTGATDESDYGTLFGTVCGLGDTICAGIAANGTTGTYGAYGMCNATEQLAYAFNNYYQAQSKVASACDFSGAASTKAASTGASGCAALVSQAGSDGTGTVTAGANAGTGAAGSSGGSSGSAASSSGAAGVVGVPSFDTGVLPMIIVVTMATFSGMGMILL